jgi:adenosylmethionine-8-amino-7-oxononanoate aminotransferase
VDTVDQTLEQARQQGRPYSAFLYEPAVQGAAGIVPQPSGWLRRVAERVRAHGALLIADEVFTGFGRTHPFDQWNSLFASHTEGVQPDLMALAKGLTGGYMPLAATLCRSSIFDAFLGTYDSFKTFFLGHSYTGKPLGCAVASASLSLLEAPGAEKRRGHIAKALATELATLWDCPWVGDIRQIGLIAGVELVRDWTQRTPFALSERVGIRVCQAMAKRGVLTRPVGNVIVFVPPYVTTKRQIQTMVGALKDALDEVLG